MLKKLTCIDGVSGQESLVRDAIIEEIKGFCTSYETDSMGNLIVYKNAKNNNENTKTIILSAHMDEVGLIVTGITKGGMLKIDTLGGIDTAVLLSKRVRCKGVYGVVGLKPFHHLSEDEKKEKPSLDDLYIDIGAKSKEDAKKYIKVGDGFTFDSDFEEFGNGLIKAKALDDRVGCILIIDALKEEYNVNIICLFNVQEELGLRGAKASVYGKSADYALVLEGTTAGDTTGAKPQMTVTYLKEGPSISIMDSASIADREFFLMLKNTAEKNGIKYQFKKAATGGNDAGAIHIANGGIKTCSVSVPVRYLHSPQGVISRDDFEGAKKLVKAFLSEL